MSNNSSTSGSAYIDGFTDGLIGASVGDVIDSNVTFPDEYPNNPDLAGKEVVFTFTVNSIQKEVTMDTMDDEFALEQFGVCLLYTSGIRYSFGSDMDGYIGTD